MKKRISLLALAATALMANAAPRSAAEALAVARQFVASTSAFKAVANYQMTISSDITARAKARGIEATAPYYIVNLAEDNGYVVVSGDDRFNSILGYSAVGNITDAKALPDPVQYWLDMLADEMESAKAAGYQRTGAKAAGVAYSESVEPMLTSQWDQTKPYNNKIPNYATGCVATGLAQIMYYWKYPERGIGSHTNANNTSYSSDFGNTVYDWANMKDTYGGKYDTPEQVNAVATLMYDLGVACDMQWHSPQEGSATGYIYGASALIKYFGYNPNLYIDQRDSHSLGSWKALIINELLAGRPVAYCGQVGNNRASAGHFFILDGYDATTGLFHFNWGWSGYCDGYYNLTALEPGTGGTGAGAGSYNYFQQALINVQPEVAGEYVTCFDAKEIHPQQTEAKAAKFNMVTNELSHNSIDFSGTFGLAIYDTEGTFLKYVPSTTNIPVNFLPGLNFIGDTSWSFTLADIADGDYVVCMAAQKTGIDKVTPMRATYGNPYYYKMTVKGADLTFAPVQSDFNLIDTTAPAIVAAAVPNTVYQHKLATFTITVKNTGTTEFYDEIGVCIKKSRDSYPQYIMVPCSIMPGEEKTISLSGTIVRDPGEYNLLACYGENGEYSTLDNSVAITIEDEANAISGVNAEDANTPIYTISGIKVRNSASMSKGIYIQNGKKVIIK